MTKQLFLLFLFFESIVDRVREYIKKQEEHHQKKTYAQEYDELIEKYGFEKFRTHKILAKAQL